MSDFLEVIAPPLAELLRTVADYLDLMAEEGEEPEARRRLLSRRRRVTGSTHRAG
jgi:hypothetical protein